MLKPDYAKAYCSRGTAYSLKGDHVRAIVDYTHAVELDPDFAMAYCLRGMAHSRVGHNDQARRDYEKSIELDPNGRLAPYAKRSLGRLEQR